MVLAFRLSVWSLRATYYNKKGKKKENFFSASWKQVLPMNNNSFIFSHFPFSSFSHLQEAFFQDVPEIQYLLTIFSLPIREPFQGLLNAPKLLIFTQSPFLLQGWPQLDIREKADCAHSPKVRITYSQRYYMFKEGVFKSINFKLVAF